MSSIRFMLDQKGGIKKEEKDKKKLALNSFEHCDCPHCRRKEKQIKKASGLKKKTMVININQK